MHPKFFAFSFHILHAITINIVRLFYYGIKSKGKSLILSFCLITSELFTLPLALFFDIWALPKQLLGSSILSIDFVSMSHIEKASKKMTPSLPFQKNQLHSLIKITQKVTSLLKEATDYLEIYPALVKEIDKLIALEKKSQCHFQMTKHMLESVTGIIWNQKNRSFEEQKKVKTLFQFLIRSHIQSFSLAILFDRLAHPLHEKGIGILIHDIPEIPYQS